MAVRMGVLIGWTHLCITCGTQLVPLHVCKALTAAVNRQGRCIRAWGGCKTAGTCVQQLTVVVCAVAAVVVQALRTVRTTHQTICLQVCHASEPEAWAIAHTQVEVQLKVLPGRKTCC